MSGIKPPREERNLQISSTSWQADIREHLQENLVDFSTRYDSNPNYTDKMNTWHNELNNHPSKQQQLPFPQGQSGHHGLPTFMRGETLIRRMAATPAPTLTRQNAVLVSPNRSHSAANDSASDRSSIILRPRSMVTHPTNRSGQFLLELENFEKDITQSDMSSMTCTGNTSFQQRL